MEIKVPAVGESVFEALIARWLKQEGDRVARDEPICEIETDKITLEVTAESDGVLSIAVPEGTTVKIGTVIGTINPAPAREPQATPPVQKGPEREPTQPEPPPQPAKERPERHEQPQPRTSSPSGRKLARTLGVPVEPVEKEAPAPELAPAAQPAPPSAPEEVPPSVTAAAAIPSRTEAPVAAPAPGSERVTRKSMTPIRKRIAERLVSVRQTTAMLTTFNEADMTRVIELRKKYGEHFLKRHQVKLGLMSLFVRACCEALQEFPEVNASIDGNDIVYHHYCDIGVAVGTERGLVVPVLRGAETLTLAQIEQRITELGEKARRGGLALADLEGGTFTVSNGGVYGSLLSTPMLNPPQSGVLGMHAIQERAVVKDGEVVARPMMYLALSYDHRIVDGQGAVTFLKRVKEYVEEPEEMLLEG